jgi:hypothetical protein
MLNTRLCLVALASLAGTIACSDHPSVTTGPRPPQAAVSPPAVAARAEALARRLALALRSPAFRAYLKARLDGSPFREHKLHFQRFLADQDRHAFRELARQSGASAGDVERDVAAAIPLELYFPVQAHRSVWAGSSNVLVATAIADHEAPVAFDPQGNRMVLSADRPPPTPVLALVPMETDFTAPPPRPSPLVECFGCGGGGWGGSVAPPPVTPGLYMTRAHFVQTFEGWLKGSPEFEVHILGQKGQTDSLTDYQCAGEHQSVPYNFDQNDLDWSGSVLLFSKAQLDGYNTGHPGQNVRVFFAEDDDTPCQIKTGNGAMQNTLTSVDAGNQALTAGKDTTGDTMQRLWKFARAFLRLIEEAASLINTNDELVGNAVQDSIAVEFHEGFNWIVKGEGNVTNGWVKLEMR